MALQVADAFIRLVMDEKALQQAVGSQTGPAATAAAGAGKTVGDRFAGSFSNSMTVVGAAGGALFAGAIQAGTAFEDQLRTINTVAKLSDQELDAVGKSILDLSRESGKSTDELTAGFYDLVSAGIPADKAIETLRSSSILATGALGTTGEAVDLVTSALGAYKLDASNATRVTDIFAQAVADGKTTVSDLAGGISTVAPIAAAAGISLEEVAAATSLMTVQGDSASQAMTRIRNAISAILTPNATLAELSKKTGINFANLAKEKGLAVTLDEIRKATGGNNEEFAKALGSSEALTLAFSVTGENAGAMATELGKVEDAADHGGVAMGQYEEAQKSAAAEGRKLTAGIKAFLIEMGGPFIQTLGPALQTVNLLGPSFGGARVGARLLVGGLGALLARGVVPLTRGLKELAAAGKLGGFLQDLSLGRGLEKSLRDALGGLGRSGPVRAAVAASAKVLGPIFAGAMFVESKIAEAGSAAISKATPGISGASKLLGTTAGKVMSGAFAAAAIVGLAVTYLEILDQVKAQSAALVEQAKEFARQASTEALKEARAGVEQAAKDQARDAGVLLAIPLIGGLLSSVKQEAANGAQGVVDVIDQEIVARANHTMAGVAEGAGSIGPALRDASPAVRSGAEAVGTAIAEPIDQGGKTASGAVTVTASDILTTIRGLRDDLRGAANEVASALYDPVIAAQELADTQAELAAIKTKLRSKNLTDAEVAELNRRRAELGKTLIQQTGDFLTYGTQAEQIAKTKSFLASNFWVDAYRNATPEQKLALDQWRTALETRLSGMVNTAEEKGGLLRDKYTGEIREGKPGVDKGTVYMTSGIDGKLGKIKDDAAKWGGATAKAYADALEAKYGYVSRAAQTVASAVTNGLKATSPPVATSPLHDIPKWGERTIEAYAEGLLGGQSDVAAATASITDEVRHALYDLVGPRGAPPTFAASVAGARGETVLASREWGAAMGSDRYSGRPTGAPTTAVQIGPINVEGLLKARDPLELADQLRRFADTGTWDTPREYR